MFFILGCIHNPEQCMNVRRSSLLEFNSMCIYSKKLTTTSSIGIASLFKILSRTNRNRPVLLVQHLPCSVNYHFTDVPSSTCISHQSSTSLLYYHCFQHPGICCLFFIHNKQIINFVLSQVGSLWDSFQTILHFHLFFKISSQFC